MQNGTTNLFHPLLFEPHYWQGRLARLDGRARRMLIAPRPDLALEVGGLEVVELILRGHDGLRLHGFVARSPITGPPKRMLLHWPPTAALRFEEVEPGVANLHLFKAQGRRLEDRVLDLVCLLCAARSLLAQAGERPPIKLAAGQACPDEYRIGSSLLSRGWCDSIESEITNDHL